MNQNVSEKDGPVISFLASQMMAKKLDMYTCTELCMHSEQRKVMPCSVDYGKREKTQHALYWQKDACTSAQ